MMNTVSVISAYCTEAKNKSFLNVFFPQAKKKINKTIDANTKYVRLFLDFRPHCVSGWLSK